MFAPSVPTQEPRNIANSRAEAFGKNTLRGCVSTRVRTPMRVKYWPTAWSILPSSGMKPVGPWIVMENPSG